MSYFPSQNNQGAVIVGPYRYTLWRVWDAKLPRALWVMLNPSVADEHVNDPTLRRVIGFSRVFGFGRLEVVNLFAFRSPDPGILTLVPDPIGAENDFYIQEASKRAGIVIAAWGSTGTLYGRDRTVLSLLGSPVYCLGVTRSGSPRHPLYLRCDTSLCRFSR